MNHYPTVYHIGYMRNLGFHAPRKEILYLGFEEAPARPDDYEAVGMFIVERKSSINRALK